MRLQPAVYLEHQRLHQWVVSNVLAEHDQQVADCHVRLGNAHEHDQVAECHVQLWKVHEHNQVADCHVHLGNERT